MIRKSSKSLRHQRRNIEALPGFYKGSEVWPSCQPNPIRAGVLLTLTYLAVFFILLVRLSKQKLKSIPYAIFKVSPWCLSGKETAYQCRRQRFNPCIRKIPWSWQWQPTPVFLPGKSHCQRSLTGYSPWGYKITWINLLTKTITTGYEVFHSLNSFPKQ